MDVFACFASWQFHMFCYRNTFLPGLIILKEGQPQLSILKLRFSNLNLCGSPAPAPPISMLTHDVCVFCFFSLARPCLNIEILGAGGTIAWWPSSRSEFKYWKLLGVVTNEVWQHDVHTFTHARICEHAHTLGDDFLRLFVQSTSPNKRYV